MNNNIPYIQCYIKDKYLFSDESREGLTECYVFGVKCLLNRPLLFHCQLKNGAIFWSFPISAFVWKHDYERVGQNETEALNELEWWNVQSFRCDVTTFWYLEGYEADLRSRTGKIYRGKYLFTIDDYYGPENLTVGYAEDSDSKCFHIFKLDNGNFAAYQNCKILWYNLNFVDRKLPIPKYSNVTWNLRAESNGK